ncbi:hypothetical protein DID78_01530 [Candidatus Marinamargulisbacteria bacterium SCGC AG-343-D04]|nr:hypothetical protein DID78_01530 [Candidatus Marinamargulisbacteria bacterium SCGC AG-343-D04]
MTTSKTINKKKCAQLLSHYMDWTQKESIEFIEKSFNWIKKEMLNGHQVLFPGFGSFKINKRKARRLIHPTTKKPMIISERMAPQFTGSPKLIKQINQKVLI